MPVDATLAQEQYQRYCYCRDNGHLDFVAKADRCEKFFAGDQWREEDLNALKAQKRPAMTINKIISTLSTILGEQIYNRTETLVRPKNGSPAEVAEALTKVFLQISQNNQLQWARSDWFCDGVVRGRGFLDVRLDFDDSMMGEVRVTNLNSKNVVIDCDADEYDPDAWNDAFVTKWLSAQDIAVLYSEADAELLKTRAASSFQYGYDSIERVRDRFAGPMLTAGMDDDKDDVRRTIRVVERQFRMLDKQLFFVDVETGDMRAVPQSWDRDRIALLLEKTGGRIATTKKLVKRIRWRVTADDVVLHDDWSPYKHFTVVPYFPFFRYGRTVGIVENLLGPQEILNKVSSQELHIVNTTANSGWIVEQDSLLNMTIAELEVTGARTGLVLEYKKGAQPPEKITPNPTPTGLDRVSYKSEEHIKSISGVSDSMQGFDREDVAAKAIAYKQQRGSVNLTKPMDNLERSDYILARNILDIVQEYYTEPRLLTITHDDVTMEAEQVGINQPDATGTIVNDLTVGEYDVVITSTPYRATMEDSQFEQARALRELGVPIPDSVLIENSRLMRRSEIVKQMEAASQSPEAQKQAQLQMEGLEAEVALKKAQAIKVSADAQLNGTRAQKEAVGDDGAQVELEKARAELEMERERLAMELEAKTRELELKEREMAQKLQMKEQEHIQDMQLRQREAAHQEQLAERQAEAQRAEQIRQQSAEKPSQGVAE